MEINPVKGTHDIYLKEANEYQLIENTARAVAELFSYSEIRTPIIEHTPLFLRSVGESSDIVSKEMYTFDDKGGRSITLRPEMTAGVLRSVVSNKLYATPDLPLKLYYLGPCFRYERPQAGRYRQFHQFGVEVLGNPNYHLDSEVIALGHRILLSCGLTNVEVKINSLGDETSRNNYREALKKYFADKVDKMCEDCKRRYEVNPLRILDCKVPEDIKIVKGAPKMSDFLTPEAKANLNDIIADLKSIGIEVSLDDNLVRGLDYYTGVVFEYHVKDENLVDVGALGGGGHYANLLKELGGPDLEGVGMSIGVERLHYVVSELTTPELMPKGPDVYLMGTSEYIIEQNVAFADMLRSSGFATMMNYEVKSLKLLFKIASRNNAKLAVIIGEDELTKNTLTVKNMLTGEQTSLKKENWENVLSDLLKEYVETYYSKVLAISKEEKEGN